MSFLFLLLLLLFFMQMLGNSDGRGFPAGDDWSSSPSMGYFSRNSETEEGGSEIDPLYGVEKRFVPQGPNALHN
ncbi:hypothetical protein KSP40_PGU017860 [Platanthera guangdongensis]|uniref:Uncharacterized protein n=1 Tax=Platanthera guangdongensis TaxID=2320717 RepID=A0ABR2LZH9_9ASPA